MTSFERRQLKEESGRIRQQQQPEQDRLTAEAEPADKERKLQELRAKPIPKQNLPPGTHREVHKLVVKFT